jgi:long-chain acyl-CoA synthetase
VSFNPEKKIKVGTVGQPLPGVLIELRDDDGKKLKPVLVGEIWVKGDNVMQGYYRKPKETAEALTKDKWLKTGDLGRLDDEGYLSIVDRKKDLIIVKGLNVYPQEIENVIEAVPNVKEVAVVGKPDPNTGEELIRAFVVPAEGTTIDKNAVMDACREHLAAYKRPKDVIILKELPKNALQKVLKKELRKL